MLLPLPRRPGLIRGGSPRIDWQNQLTLGLTGFWLFGLGVPGTGGSGGAVINLVTGRTSQLVNSTGGFYSDSFPIKMSASSIGIGVQNPFQTYYWNLGRAADLYGTAGSFGIVRRFINTTAEGAIAVGDDGVGSLNIYLPYSDSNVYFDFPGSGTGRISFAYTMSTDLEAWTFTASNRGRSVFRNGSRLYNDTTTTATGTPGTTNLLLNKGALGGYDNMEWYAFATWSRQLNDADGQSFSLDPIQFLSWPEDDLFAELVGAAAAAADRTPYNPWPLQMPLLAQ